MGRPPRWAHMCVYVSVAQAIPMRFLFDEMQDDVFGEAPQGCPEV